MIIDSNGIKLNSFDEIYNNLADGMKAIYGEDINLDQDTPDGQCLGIYANATYDMQSWLARVYNSFDPDLAEGHELDKLMKLVGVVRHPATKSSVDVDITTDRAVALPKDYTLIDENDKQWVISQPTIIDTTKKTITFIAKDWGAVRANVNTITKAVNILKGVVDITNPQAATVGKDEESDVELRKRRNRTLQNGSNSISGALLSKLLALNGVDDAIIYENNTNNPYAIYDDLPARTIWIIVSGGEIDAISEVIAKGITLGCAMKGNISSEYKESFKKRNGATTILTTNVKFDRPLVVTLYIKFDLIKKQNVEYINVKTIEEAISNFTFNIGEQVEVSELSHRIYSIGSGYTIDNLQVSWDGTHYFNKISTRPNQKLILSPDRVIING